MSIVRRAISAIRNLVYYAERERVDEKFSIVDARLDKIEILVAVNSTEIKANREIFLSHLESVEQMINAIKASQEALNLVTKHQYSYLDGNLNEIQALLRSLK